MENGVIDLSLNDRRRAFSDAYNNMVLAESTLYIEISTKNPLSKLPGLEITDLKKTPCILVMNQTSQKEEQEYYETIIGPSAIASPINNILRFEVVPFDDR